MILAAAGLAEMTQQEQRELDIAIFVGSLVPLVFYLLIAGCCWIVLYRRCLRSKRLSLQSILVGTAFIAPTLLLAKLVAIPYWWYD